MAPGPRPHQAPRHRSALRQRHRIGRLFAAVALNPFLIGVGIDEDTAIVLDASQPRPVIGHGTVTIIDGGKILYTDIHETAASRSRRAARPLRCTCSRTVHGFDIDARVPAGPKAPTHRCRGPAPPPARPSASHRARFVPPSPRPRRHRSRRPTEESDVKLLETRVYRGPSLYGYRPVIRLTVDLEELEQYPSTRSRLRRQAPRRPALARRARLLVRRAGGFVKRLSDGHVVRSHHRARGHRAAVPRGHARHLRQDARRRARGRLPRHLQLRRRAVGKPRRARSPSTTCAASCPTGFADRLEPAPTTSAKIEGLARLAERVALGPSTRSLVEEAKRRGIPTLRLNEHSLVQLGWGVHQKRIQATVTSQTSHIAVEIAQDKQLTASLLERAGLPVPRQDARGHRGRGRRDRGALRLPGRGQADGSLARPRRALNLTDEAQVREAFDKAYDLSSYVLVETFQEGFDHRILVVNGESSPWPSACPGTSSATASRPSASSSTS
jgi:hypothetical protein